MRPGQTGGGAGHARGGAGAEPRRRQNGEEAVAGLQRGRGGWSTLDATGRRGPRGWEQTFRGQEWRGRAAAELRDKGGGGGRVCNLPLLRLERTGLASTPDAGSNKNCEVKDDAKVFILSN